MRRWWCTIVQEGSGRYCLIFVEMDALKTAWKLYREGRVFDAATLLNTGYAPVFLPIDHGTAKALEEAHPKGYWVVDELPGAAEELWLHIIILGWEGAMEAPFVMCLLPSLDTHEVVRVDDEVLELQG